MGDQTCEILRDLGRLKKIQRDLERPMKMFGDLERQIEMLRGLGKLINILESKRDPGRQIEILKKLKYLKEQGQLTFYNLER